MSGQDGGSYGLKDVYGGMAGLGRKPPRREMIERAKRSPLRVRARKVCNTTQKKEYPFDLDAYHLAAEDRSEYKRIAHVRTPAGVEKYGQPIGTLIVADGPGGAEDIIDNLKYEGRPYGPGWVVVSDGNGKHYDVGFDDEDTQKWVATSTEGGWDDVIVEGGESDSDIIRKLSAKLRKDGVPTIKEVEEAKKKAPAKRTNIRKKPAATTKSGKKKKTTITKKKAAGGLTLSKALARSGGDQTPEDKLDKEGYVFIDPNAPKVRVRQVLHKKTNTNRRNPADYFVRNGKPVHTDAQVDAAFLASGGTQAALDKARSEGRSPIRPAHNNKYLWIAKDPKGGVAYSAVAVIPATDRNGKKTYKVPPARYQLNSAGEPHRVAVQTKEMADANLMQKRAKIISLVAHIYKLDKALQKDMDNDPNAGAVALMRILGIRVNSKNEEDQAKQQKSPEKAERLRKLGIDPDQPIFGAATLQARHVRIDGDTVYIDFMGKELVRNTHAVRDPLLVKMLKKHMRGKRNNDPLFPGVDANTTKAYIQKHMGAGVTNKDLRDLAATHLAARYVSEMPAPKTQTEFDMLQAEVAYRVALTLNNKASESLGSYIAPPVWDTWKKALQT